MPSRIRAFILVEIYESFNNEVINLIKIAVSVSINDEPGHHIMADDTLHVCTYAIFHPLEMHSIIRGSRANSRNKEVFIPLDTPAYFEIPSGLIH